MPLRPNRIVETRRYNEGMKILPALLILSAAAHAIIEPVPATVIRPIDAPQIGALIPEAAAVTAGLSATAAPLLEAGDVLAIRGKEAVALVSTVDHGQVGWVPYDPAQGYMTVGLPKFLVTPKLDERLAEGDRSGDYRGAYEYLRSLFKSTFRTQ
jgi:hypothetical protein